MAAEIGHQAGELRVGAALDQRRDGALVAEVVEEPLSPGGPALEGQGRVELVRGAVDPLAQPLAAGLREGRLHERAVLEHHHVPAEGAEQVLEAAVKAFANHGVEALAVVVDHPPGVAQALLPALQERLEDVALVHLRVADQRHHAPFGAVLGPAVGLDVVLDQRGEEGLRHAQADRAGGEVDVVAVLGPRGVGLRPSEGAERLQLRPGLAAEEILDGVEDRACVRLHGHPVLGPEHREVERGHHRRERGGGGLVPADLEAVRAVASVVSVVDGPGGEPQDLPLKLGEVWEAGVLDHCRSSIVRHGDRTLHA